MFCFVALCLSAGIERHSLADNRRRDARVTQRRPRQTRREVCIVRLEEETEEDDAALLAWRAICPLKSEFPTNSNRFFTMPEILE